MEKEKITLIVKATINPTEMESFNAYIVQLTQLFEKARAESIGHFPIKETFVGTENPSFIAIYRFKNRAAFNAVYETEVYKNDMLPLRNKGFKQLEVYLS